MAELESALGIDAQPAGLDNHITHAFPGVEVTYGTSPERMPGHTLATDVVADA
jgi:hypothetical protein